MTPKTLALFTTISLLILSSPFSSTSIHGSGLSARADAPAQALCEPPMAGFVRGEPIPGAIRIVGWNSARLSGSSYGLATGTAMNFARDYIRANFPGATFAEVERLTPDALSDPTFDVNIAFLFAINDGNPGNPLVRLTEGEQAVLLNFVLNGGSAILCADEDRNNLGDTTTLLAPFNMSATGVIRDFRAVAVIDDVENPIAMGPFGLLRSRPFVQLFPSSTLQLSPMAQRLAANMFGDPAAAWIPPGQLAENSGAVVVFTDVNMFARMQEFGTLDLCESNIELLLNSLAACVQARQP